MSYVPRRPDLTPVRYRGQDFIWIDRQRGKTLKQMRWRNPTKYVAIMEEDGPRWYKIGRSNRKWIKFPLRRNELGRPRKG